MDCAQKYDGILEHLRESHEAAKFQLVMTELDLAITFCQLAISTEHKAKAERNFENAKQAYDSAIRFLDSATLTAEKREQVHRRIVRLTPMLKRCSKFRKSQAEQVSPRPSTLTPHFICF